MTARRLAPYPKTNFFQQSDLPSDVELTFSNFRYLFSRGFSAIFFLELYYANRSKRKQKADTILYFAIYR